MATGEVTPRVDSGDGDVSIVSDSDISELEFDMPEGVKLTAKEIKQLQAAGLDGNVQVEDFQFKGAVDEEMEEMTIVGNAGKDGKPIKRKVVRRPSVKLSPATVCMVNPQRGLELMIAFEKREARKGMIASCLGYILVIALCAACSWVAIVYGQLLFERVGTGAARGFLASWGFSIVWDLLVMEWVAAGKKFVLKLASATVLPVLVGAYSLSNWYEDYSDFTTIDMMAGDDVLDELTAAMDDIESGD